LIPVMGSNAVWLWPLPCIDDGAGDRTSDRAVSWPFVVAKAKNEEVFADVVDNGIPIVAVVCIGAKGCKALLRFNNPANRTEWMRERDRLVPRLMELHAELYHYEKLVPLPGTIGKDGISRLIYFNPEAPAVP